MIRAFFLEPTNRQRRYLRRYKSGRTADGHFHDSSALLDVIPNSGEPIRAGKGEFENDPHWPIRCDCGYEFAADDEWQVFRERIYVRKDTGDEMSLRDAPPGAMWNAEWYPDSYKGPDGRALIAVCPGGHHWHIDGRASNCTMPQDKIHKCWIRHGEPPNLTVDKNGVTCAAGAGSIQTPNWHGFLRDGCFVE